MASCGNSTLSPIVQALSSLPSVVPSADSLLGDESNTNGVTSIVDAWFWGALIVILSVGVLLLLCMFYCCVCCCVYCGKKSRNQKAHKCPKIFCALFTTIFITTSIILLCVSVWLETEVDKGLTMFSLPPNATATPSFTLFQSFEFFRFRAALAVLSVVIIFLFLSLLAFWFAPACKSPAAIIVFMVVHVLLALLLSVYAGVTFTLTVFGSDLCVVFYSNKTMCSLAPVEEFCNDVLVDEFTIVMLVCVSVLILFSMQIFGSIYANLVRRTKYTKVETVGQSSEMFISNPLNVGGTFHAGVWNAYGAQTVLGVKSRGQDIPSGYTPEAYPMGAVAPVAPIAPLPTDGSNEMKEITLHLKEVESSSDSSNNIHIVDV